MVSLQPVKAESLSTQVADKIRQAIFTGELKPGETLRELVLARKMEVSQATVREALSYLETYGLVVRTPNRSTAVTSLTATDIRDRVAIRRALEVLALADAAKAATASDWQEIDACAEAMRRALASGVVAEIWNAERGLCRRLWLASGNALLVRMLDQTSTPLYALWDGRDIPRVETVDVLLDAVRLGDRDSIDRALAKFLAAAPEANAATSGPAA
ncbi:MAG: GntR family transcriptional regulator [Bryobacterales bacterium]|nr:GntR family transcriptional regulator [Bryobacterales bacterium]